MKNTPRRPAVFTEDGKVWFARGDLRANQVKLTVNPNYLMCVVSAQWCMRQKGSDAFAFTDPGETRVRQKQK